jgi:hypothetical protein
MTKLTKICEHCGSRYALDLKPQKHVHSFGTEPNSGYFSVVDGRRVSHTQFCACGISRVVDLATEPPKPKGLTLKGARTNGS